MRTIGAIDKREDRPEIEASHALMALFSLHFRFCIQSSPNPDRNLYAGMLLPSFLYVPLIVVLGYVLGYVLGWRVGQLDPCDPPRAPGAAIVHR